MSLVLVAASPCGAWRISPVWLRACQVLDGCTGLVGAPWLQDLLEKLLRDAQGVHVLTTTKSPLGGLPSICTCSRKQVMPRMWSAFVLP